MRNSVRKKVLSAVLAGSLVCCGAETLPGVGTIIEKARKGEPLTAVFLGGSLTWGASASDPNLTSWRGLTMRMLREKYPRTPWTFYDAAIGGTGSQLGVFRMERDVLRWKPDLVFLEFTLNDGLKGTPGGFHDLSNQSYEAIIRQCLSRKIAVLPVFLTARNFTEAKDISQFKRRTQHIELFQKYQLEYADVLGLMNRDFLDKKLDTEALWPTELFDMTHPHDPGYAAYFRAFRKEWDRIEKSPLLNPVLPEHPLTGESFNHLLRIEVPQLNLRGWTRRPPFLIAEHFDWMASRWIDQVAITSNAEQVHYHKYKLSDRKLQTLKFSFKGEMIGLMLEIMPHSVPLSVSIDGGKPRIVKFPKAKYAQFYHTVLARNLDPKRFHKIVIKPQEPPKGKVGIVRLGSILINGRTAPQLKQESPSGN